MQHAPLCGRQRRPGLLGAMWGNEGQLLVDGLDPGKTDWGAGNDGLIPVGR